MINTPGRQRWRDPSRSRSKPPLGLQTRLNLTLGLAMAVIVGIGFLFAIHDARQSVRNEARSTVSLALQLLEAGFAGEDGNGKALSGWMSRLGGLDKIRHLRISVIGPQASAINFSGHHPAAARQEAPGWFRWAVTPEPIRVERLLHDDRQQPLTIRIEGSADDEILEAWSETQGFLILLLSLAGAVYALVNLLVGRAFGPVVTILEGLAHIEHGEYDKRLPAFPLPEFDGIASAFNLMAGQLEKTRDENRALVRHSMLIQEEERRHLARELHDELGQSLTAIKAMAATLLSRNGEANTPARQIVAICDHLFGVVRSMMRRLRPSVLDELGLSASLEDLVESFRSRHPELKVHLRCAAGVDARCPTSAIDLFRITQECLTNTVKHGQAREVAIDLGVVRSGATEWVVLRLRDDGCGFDPMLPQRGFGLRGIRERVAGLGGEMAIRTGAGKGVDIDIRVPAEGAPS
ncbi:histidine kinase [Methyloparacoccus murrellii]